MYKTFWIATALAAVAAFSCAGAYAAGNCCTTITTGRGQEYRLEYNTVTEPVQHTSYRKVVETQYVEEDVTTYEQVWETQQRERRYTVARTVPETSYVERRYTVNRTVEETEHRDTSYEVKRMVPETTYREEKYLVPKQVIETQQREVRETRRVPVEETVMQERYYTTNRAVTSLQTQTVDRGGYVNDVTARPGRTYHRLAWQRMGDHYDPATGTSRFRLPGLYWTPMQGPERVEVNKVYRPNYVSETVPVTTFVPEQRIEQIPVTRTTYRDETVSRVEDVQVARVVQEEHVRQIPVTRYKEVVERVEQTTPVKVQRVIPEERVETIPQTTYKTITEEKIEPYEVKVARIVPVTRTVKKPVTVERWVPYTYTVEKQRVVVNRIPINPVVVSTTVVERSASPSGPTLLPGERIVNVVDRVVTPDVARPETAPAVLETEDLPGKSSPYDKKPEDRNDPADEKPRL